MAKNAMSLLKSIRVSWIVGNVAGCVFRQTWNHGAVLYPIYRAVSARSFRRHYGETDGEIKKESVHFEYCVGSGIVVASVRPLNGVAVSNALDGELTALNAPYFGLLDGVLRTGRRIAAARESAGWCNTGRTASVPAGVWLQEVHRCSQKETRCCLEPCLQSTVLIALRFCIRCGVAEHELPVPPCRFMGRLNLRIAYEICGGSRFVQSEPVMDDAFVIISFVGAFGGFFFFLPTTCTDAMVQPRCCRNVAN